MNREETFTLTVNGRRYERWEEIRVTREIDRMCTDFNIAVSERFLAGAADFPLAPFMPCTVAIGGDVVLTGYIDNYLPEVEADRHTVRITGRSKTEDIIDCTPDIQGGQFAGYKLDAIARAIGQSVGKPYPIDVVVEVDVGDSFPDATIERHETGFAFLERLCRLRSVLATDDEQGRLVLTRAGGKRTTDMLLQGPGGNVQWAAGVFSGARRFSHYKVRAQQTVHGSTSPSQSWQDVQSGFAGAASADEGGEDDFAEEGDAVATDAQVPVLTEVEGTATDPGVPRYRPHVMMGESARDGPGAMRRAVWQAKYNAARGTQARIIVSGWRQSDGSLWRINHLVPVRIPFLSLEMELLIAGVTYGLDGNRGRHTELTVGPVDGYQPDPGQVRQHRQKNRHKGGGGVMWDGVGQAGADASFTV
jgi:prophage tail gpP-like protein